MTGTSTANDKLQYTSRGFHAQTLTYIEHLYIAPLYFDIELNIKPDDSDEDESYETLTLSTIAQSTNSALVAGILSWLINVGSNFAHVSPSFRYKEVTDSDRYCDILDLAFDLAMSYVVHTIKQVSASFELKKYHVTCFVTLTTFVFTCSVTRLSFPCIYLEILHFMRIKSKLELPTYLSKHVST